MHSRSVIVACSILTCGLWILGGAGTFWTRGVDPNPPGVSSTISGCKQIAVALHAYNGTSSHF